MRRGKSEPTRRGRSLRLLRFLCATGGIASSAAQLEAQSALVLEPRAGIVFPAGGLDAVADVGFAVGFSASRELRSRVAIRVEALGLFLNDRVDPLGVVPAPPLNFVHVLGGVEIDFAPPANQGTPLSLRFRVGAGGTWISGAETYADGSSVDVSELRPTVASGVAIGYRLSATAEVFVDTAILFTILPEEATEVFAERSVQVLTFSNMWTAPITLGFRVGL